MIIFADTSVWLDHWRRGNPDQLRLWTLDRALASVAAQLGVTMPA